MTRLLLPRQEDDKIGAVTGNIVVSGIAAGGAWTNYLIVVVDVADLGVGPGVAVRDAGGARVAERDGEVAGAAAAVGGLVEFVDDASLLCSSWGCQWFVV